MKYICKAVCDEFGNWLWICICPDGRQLFSHSWYQIRGMILPKFRMPISPTTLVLNA